MKYQNKSVELQPAAEDSTPSSEEAPITKKELAKRLRKSCRTVENWTRKGYIPQVKLGHSSLYFWSDVVRNFKNFTVNG